MVARTRSGLHGARSMGLSEIQAPASNVSNWSISDDRRVDSVAIAQEEGMCAQGVFDSTRRLTAAFIA